MSGLDYKYLSMVNALASTWLFLEAQCFPTRLFPLEMGRLNLHNKH